MKRCVIFGAGEYDEAPPPADADVYIAADGGLREMRKRGITPDLLIGDLDSLGGAPEGVPLIRLPVKKDVTDLDAAIGEGLARGCDTFELYGVLGGRPDHSYANISLIARLAKRGIRAVLHGAGYSIEAVCCGALSLPARETGTVSVFSFTDRSEGVTIRGLQYPLDNAALTADFALGVSNAFTGQAAEISVREGILIVMTENP